MVRVCERKEIHSRIVLVPLFEEHLFKRSAFAMIKTRRVGLHQTKKNRKKGGKGWKICAHPLKCLVYIPFHSTQFYSFKEAALCACYCSNPTEFQFPLSLAL